jgi:hypothetical protein
MIDDPIVREVRAVRDELARRLNYDIHAIFADLRAREDIRDPEHPLARNAAEPVAPQKKIEPENEKTNQRC